jgi:peroxiredoxin (alkyl hydroperoxide reductase subunit C)
MNEKKDFKGIPLIGDEFPEIQANSTHGIVNLPKDFKRKWFILFSHPADFTPVCTTEFLAFAKKYDKFKELNCELIGLSIDQVFAHMKWVEWINDNLETKIPFPIIADHGNIASMLGMVHPGKGSNTVRAVFLVDPKGFIRLILYYPQELGRNIEEIIRIVEAIQIADDNNVAMPANWPNNELIGRQVIIPPPKDEETAKERPKTYSCYDWWFCYKSLEYE